MAKKDNFGQMLNIALVATLAYGAYQIYRANKNDDPLPPDNGGTSVPGPDEGVLGQGPDEYRAFVELSGPY